MILFDAIRHDMALGFIFIIGGSVSKGTLDISIIFLKILYVYWFLKENSLGITVLQLFILKNTYKSSILFYQ